MEHTVYGFDPNLVEAIPSFYYLQGANKVSPTSIKGKIAPQISIYRKQIAYEILRGATFDSIVGNIVRFTNKSGLACSYNTETMEFIFESATSLPESILSRLQIESLEVFNTRYECYSSQEGLFSVLPGLKKISDNQYENVSLINLEDYTVNADDAKDYNLHIGIMSSDVISGNEVKWVVFDMNIVQDLISYSRFIDLRVGGPSASLDGDSVVLTYDPMKTHNQIWLKIEQKSGSYATRLSYQTTVNI